MHEITQKIVLVLQLAEVGSSHSAQSKCFWLLRRIITLWGAYQQSCVDVVQGVLGSERGLECVFDQGDVSVFWRVLSACELLGH